MFLTKKQKSLLFKFGLGLALVLIVGGIGTYLYLHPGPNLDEQLGYLRAISTSEGGYVVTFDEADWLFDKESLTAESATKNISNFKLSASLYYFLKKHPSYLNTPVAVYLDENRVVVKIELIEDTP